MVPMTTSRACRLSVQLCHSRRTLRRLLPSSPIILSRNYHNTSDASRRIILLDAGSDSKHSRS